MTLYTNCKRNPERKNFIKFGSKEQDEFNKGDCSFGILSPPYSLLAYEFIAEYPNTFQSYR